MSATTCTVNGTKVEIDPMNGETVEIGGVTVTMEEFWEIARKVLTKSNLSGLDDPRLRIVEEFSRAKMVRGYGPEDTHKLMIHD